ncbi:hypothetical protein [Alkalicoccus urumqiensis]|uniref:Uncharacterized protein n=1 Tax=Alkalicoccus urumqiensis TaxID=1548213 RepID=A0A2P6MFG5_ALKUR|nr:hypothetical protein [Alkalicoccus urumqiensis]PRO64981.1 hypothetical protein C6I21_11045 [Alkalicoccus urumqiensis]
MTHKYLKEYEFGELQQELVQQVMDRMHGVSEHSPLVYFPIVHDRVESFLIVHWSEVFEDCRHMTMSEWRESSCYDVYKSEILNEFFDTDGSIRLESLEEPPAQEA